MHLHHHFFTFLRNKELDELYASVALRFFAISLISIFTPIYLLQLHYSLASVLLFYIVLDLVHGLFIIPAARIASRYGIKHSIFFSVPFLIIYFALLFSLDTIHWPLYLLAVIFGINSAFFWLGYHIDFAKIGDRQKRGKEIGFVRFILSFVAAIGPLIGGVLLTQIGFKFVFIIVSLLLLISIFPLFFSKDTYHPVSYSIKGLFKNKKIKDCFVFFGYGVDSAVLLVIWPLFLYFFIVDDFTTLGSIQTVSFISSLIFIAFVGIFSDFRRKLLLKIGAVLNAMMWIAKTFIKTSFQAFSLDALHGMIRSMIIIPYDAITYDRANSGDILDFIIFREIIVHCGRIALFVSIYFILDMMIGFLIGSGFSLFLLLF